MKHYDYRVFTESGISKSSGLVKKVSKLTVMGLNDIMFSKHEEILK